MTANSVGSIGEEKISQYKALYALLEKAPENAKVTDIFLEAIVRLPTLENKVSKAESELVDLKEQLQTASQELAAMKTQLQAKEQEVQAVVGNHGGLSAQHRSPEKIVYEERNTSKAKVLSLEAELEAAKAELEAAKKSIKTLKIYRAVVFGAGTLLVAGLLIRYRNNIADARSNAAQYVGDKIADLGDRIQYAGGAFKKNVAEVVYGINKGFELFSGTLGEGVIGTTPVNNFRKK